MSGAGFPFLYRPGFKIKAMKDGNPKMLIRNLRKRQEMKDKITWEITSYGDCHGAGYFEVGLTGYDSDGNEYEADGEAMDGEIVEINNMVCVKGPKMEAK